MKQRDHKNRRISAAPCLIDKYSITHLKTSEIFGHGNLHILKIPYKISKIPY